MSWLINTLKDKYRTVYVSQRSLFANPFLRHVFSDFIWRFASEGVSRTDAFSLVKAGEPNKNPELKAVYIDEGFIRAFGLSQFDPKFSYTIDDLAPYVDASQTSRLEVLLQSYQLSAKELALSEMLLDKMMHYRISQYLSLTVAPEEVLRQGKKYYRHDKDKVLLLYQAEDDKSLIYSHGHKITLESMISLALKENPNAYLYIMKQSNAHWSKQAIATAKNYKDKVTIIHKNYQTLDLLGRFDRIYTISSVLGLEAILLNKDLTCLGLPFYANWGLTDDRLKLKRRTTQRSLLEFFYLTYIHYPLYTNPYAKPATELDFNHALDCLIEIKKFGLENQPSWLAKVFNQAKQYLEPV